MDKSQKILFRLAKWIEGYLTNPPKKRKMQIKRKKYFREQQTVLEADIESKIHKGDIIPIKAKKKFKIKKKKK